MKMRRFSVFAILILLLSAAAPIFACVAGNGDSHAAKACCAAMHVKCGGMKSMTCCRNDGKMDEPPQIVTSGPSLVLVWTAVFWDAIVPAELPVVPIALPRIPAEHDPPGLQIARTANLRI